LIQAAVGLYHYCNGNVRGAVKLYHTSRDYMKRYPSPHWGLDLAGFWEQMRACFAPILDAHPLTIARPEETRIPTIRLEPPPNSWPDLSEFDHGDDE
jgi:hypothetical protein